MKAIIGIAGWILFLVAAGLSITVSPILAIPFGVVLIVCAISATGGIAG